MTVRKLTYDTAIGFTAVVLLGRAGEVVRPYLISVKRRRVVFVPSGGLDAGTHFGSARRTTAVWIGSGMDSRPGSGSGSGSAMGAGGGRLCGGRHRRRFACFCLVLFRNFSESAQARLLSAVTFLPENYYKRVERMLKAFSQGMESTRDPESLVLLLCYTVLEWALS